MGASPSSGVPGLGFCNILYFIQKMRLLLCSYLMFCCYFFFITYGHFLLLRFKMNYRYCVRYIPHTVYSSVNQNYPLCLLDLNNEMRRECIFAQACVCLLHEYISAHNSSNPLIPYRVSGRRHATDK